jgi:hypothetical protein
MTENNMGTGELRSEDGDVFVSNHLKHPVSVVRGVLKDYFKKSLTLRAAVIQACGGMGCVHDTGDFRSDECQACKVTFSGYEGKK